MEYFFLGDSELVTAFRFVGIAGASVYSAADAQQIFHHMTEGPQEPGRQPCRVLIMTEQVADWLGDTLIKWQLADRYPLVVELPGLEGRLKGHKTLVDTIREAIGISV